MSIGGAAGWLPDPCVSVEAVRTVAGAAQVPNSVEYAAMRSMI